MPDWDAIPFYRKSGIAILILILIIPLGLLIIWSGPIYSRSKAGVYRANTGWKLAWSVLGLGAMFFLYQWQMNDAIENAEIPLCGSQEALEAAKSAVENSPAGRVQGLRLLAFKSSQEISWDEASQTRVCGVEAATNAGITKATLNLTWLNRDAAQFYVQIYFR